MKRVIRTPLDPEELILKIDVYHELIDIYDPIAAATEVKDILDSMGDIDPQALADYQTFQQNMWAMIDYYGFQTLRMKSSKSKPHTSKYAWIAYAEHVKQESIPLIIRLRVSDHAQAFGPERRKQIREEEQREADELKQPATKRRQKFIVSDIVVNNKKYSSYEEALNAIDQMIYKWLERLNIDLSDIEPFGVW